MEAILDSPMAADRMSKLGGISLDTEEVVARLGGDLLPNTSVVLYHADTAQTLPISIFVQGAQKRRVLNNPIVSVF
jgi:hypothetical protein